MLKSRGTRPSLIVAARAAGQGATRSLARWLLVGAVAAAVLGWLATPADALTFNLRETAPMDPAARAAFQAAADAWSGLVVTPITVNIDIGYVPMGGNILGGTSPEKTPANYWNFRSGLAAGATSSADAQALASLRVGTWFPMLTNRTLDNPNGAGSETPYLVDYPNGSNQVVSLSRANAKAVGLLGAANSGLDGSISFNSNAKWSFSSSGAVASGTYDFVGAAMHEIEHVLGFLNGSQRLNGLSEQSHYPFVTSLDLFRYSDQSKSLGAIDWTYDARDKYFSLDMGLTNLGGFSTGVTYGDGRDASHWKIQDPAIGLMDPTLAPGERARVTDLDLKALDAIGYQVVPEPCTLVALLAGACLVHRGRVRAHAGARAGLQ